MYVLFFTHKNNMRSKNKIKKSYIKKNGFTEQEGSEGIVY